jgi:hypothetical protein
LHYAIDEVLQDRKDLNLQTNNNNMRTLNISISDLEYSKFGLKTDNFSFSEFVDIISKELSKQTLNECVQLADKYGLSKMTMDEITNEVKAVRKNAKNHN